MSSAGGHEYGYDGEHGMYDAQQYGMPHNNNYPNHDGAYAPPAYNDNNYADAGGPRRHASAAALDDYYRRGGSATAAGYSNGSGSSAWGEPGAERSKHVHDLARRNRPLQHGRAYEYDDSSDDSYDSRRGRRRRGGDRSYSRGGRDDDYDDDHHHHREKRPRSLSAFGKRVSSYFGSDEHNNDGEGNTDTKKWGATLAGALAGGLAGRMANKHTIVPAALGAFVGGFTAREVEKKYHRRHEVKNKEEHRHAAIKYGAE